MTTFATVITDTCLIVEGGAIIADIGVTEVAALRASASSLVRHGVTVRGSGCYFLYNPYTERVKIGHSRSMAKRWRDLERMGGAPLHPLCFWSSDEAARVECFVHNQLSDHRVIGEWFTAEYVRDWLDGKRRPFTLPDGEIPAPELHLCTEASPEMDAAMETLRAHTVITVKELAALTGVSFSTIVRRAEEGTLPVPTSRIGQRWIIPTPPVRKWLGIEASA